ncbi:MAG: gluconate 2-dehydrogenase subunit 3 family protein [Bacteroidota bacterium]
MERRNAIKNIGKSFGAFAVTPVVIELLQSCSGPQYDWSPEFYTEQEGSFIKNLADTFLPAVDKMPSATQVNVHVFLDKVGKEVLDEDQKRAHKSAMQLSISSLNQSAGEEEVSRIDIKAYEKWLDQLFGSGASETEVSIFIEEVRDQIIWAYKNSEQVGETIMAYNPIPGKYDGCVDLMETTGGKAWSI